MMDTPCTARREVADLDLDDLELDAEAWEELEQVLLQIVYRTLPFPDEAWPRSA